MKIGDTYSHLKAKDIVRGKNGMMAEIHSFLNEPHLAFGKNKPDAIKKAISSKFNGKGWADKVKVGTSRLTINYMQQKVGVCFQLGNVARTYADILKLAQLGEKKVIEVGIIIVAHKLESKKMGANHAQYERLTKEIDYFRDIIKVPLMVIGLCN